MQLRLVEPLGLIDPGYRIVDPAGIEMAYVGMRLPGGYGYQWWLPAGGRGDFAGIGVANQFVYVDPASAVTIVELSANRAYGTAPDMSANKDGECLEYLAQSLGRFPKIK